MIILALATAAMFAFFALLAVVPNVPPMPTTISSPLDWFATFIGSSAGFVAHILTTPIFNALVFVSIAIFAFDFAWSAFWWIVVKIPFVSQHIHK